MIPPKAFLLITIFGVGVVASFSACSSSNRRESFYSTLADADKDGAITRGWIPEFLPESSRNVHEIHEISPEAEWCGFEFVPAKPQSLRKNLRSIEALPPSMTRVPDPGVQWWPKVLMGNLDISKIHGAGFELYVVETPATSVTTDVLLFAIDSAKGRAFFYGTHQSGFALSPNFH